MTGWLKKDWTTGRAASFLGDPNNLFGMIWSFETVPEQFRSFRPSRAPEDSAAGQPGLSDFFRRGCFHNTAPVSVVFFGGPNRQRRGR